MSGLRGQPDWLKKIFPSLVKEVLRLIFRKLVEWAWEKMREMISYPSKSGPPGGPLPPM